MKMLFFKIIRKLRNAISVNKRIRKSQWYHNVFLHLEEYETIQRNSDILCIGSTLAKFSVDFKNVQNVVGSNLATLPETVFYDFQVVKNYHSYLKKNGVIMLVLCPFTLLKDKYKEEDGNQNYKNIRYYPVLHRALIDNFDISLYEKWVNNPYKIGYKAWIRSIFDVPKTKILLQNSNFLSDEEMKQSAYSRVNSWMNEFKLKSLNEIIPIKLQEIIATNMGILEQMIKFNDDRGYKTVIIIPPFSRELTMLLPEEFVEAVLFSHLKRLAVPQISYFSLEDWMKKELYLDSFTLNATGRQKLTFDIINKLKIRSIL